MLPYIEFPNEEALLERLGRMDYGSPMRQAVFQSIASRFAGRTLESAAFSFMLIELLHREKSAIGEELHRFLPKCVLALTEDEDLARAARAAFQELGPPTD